MAGFEAFAYGTAATLVAAGIGGPNMAAGTAADNMLAHVGGESSHSAPPPKHIPHGRYFK
jgi:hypothetical protein